MSYFSSEKMVSQREYMGTYLSSRWTCNIYIINYYLLLGWFLQYRDSAIVESELYDENLYLRNDGNKNDDNPYFSHIYAVVNKNKDNNGSPIHSTATTAEMNDDEITVQYPEVTVWIKTRFKINNFLFILAFLLIFQ